MIGKGDRTLQRLLALLRALIRVVDWSKDTSIVHILSELLINEPSVRFTGHSFFCALVYWHIASVVSKQ